MKLIPNWQNKLLKCQFCGTTKSVKYTVELHGANCEIKPLELYACNKCALLHDKGSGYNDR